MTTLGGGGNKRFWENCETLMLQVLLVVLTMWPLCVIIHLKIVDMMCIDIWHHSGDIEAGMQQQFSL